MLLRITNWVKTAEPAKQVLKCIVVCVLFGSAAASAESIQLGAQNQTINAEFLPASKPRCIVLLSGLTGHPNEPKLIKPLRFLFAKKQWQTLAIPLQQDDESNSQLLTNALAYVQKQQCENIFLIGHGKGADTVMTFLLRQKKPLVKGGVLLSSSLTAIPNEALALIDTPILDITATHDYQKVVQAKQQRQQQLQAFSNGSYRFHRVAGADHDYIHLADELVATIHNWANKPPA